ncbi:DNA pilot protein [Microvirus sp.]|nr:DNA pilot protein [Microvirus sp.]UYL88461.1 DNA pilot protein [Microvirus sp.]
MSFWSKVGDAFKSVGKGIVNMIPGFAIGTASNAIGGAMSAKDAKRQHQYDLEKMATQHGYNIESQKLGQQFNKEMWDYTNYENQKKHLEAAGLNPALLYGMSGGGGATAAGAQGMGAGIASGHEMGIKQQGRGMGLQAAAIASQIDLNNSQAEKNRADAKKTAGVDTNLQNANIEYVIAQTSNEKVKKGLIYANTRLLDAQEELQRETVNYTKQKADEVRWNIKLIEKEVDKLSEEIDGLDLDNKFKKETLKNRIKQTSLAIQQAIADIALKGSQGRLNDTEAKAIPEKILQMWAEIGIKQESVEVTREQTENYAQDIANRLHLGEKGLEIQEQKLIIDCITGLLNIAVQGGLTPMGKIGSIIKGGK